MGDIADMMLDGILDANGEYTGKNYGYPVYPKGWFGKKEQYRDRVGGFNTQKTVVSFLRTREPISEKWNDLLLGFSVKEEVYYKNGRLYNYITGCPKTWERFKKFIDAKTNYIKPSKQPNP